MFGRKKKVDLEELISELTGDGGEDEEKPVKRSIKSNTMDYQDISGVKFKVEFEGVDELIKEIRSLRETMEALMEVLKESNKSPTK